MAKQLRLGDVSVDVVMKDIKKQLDLPFYKEWTGVDAKSRVENIEHVFGELTKRKAG